MPARTPSWHLRIRLLIRREQGPGIGRHNPRIPRPVRLHRCRSVVDSDSLDRLVTWPQYLMCSECLLLCYRLSSSYSMLGHGRQRSQGATPGTSRSMARLRLSLSSKLSPRERRRDQALCFALPVAPGSSHGCDQSRARPRQSSERPSHPRESHPRRRAERRDSRARRETQHFAWSLGSTCGLGQCGECCRRR